MKLTLKLNNQSVNGATWVTSLVLRVLCVLVGIAVIASVTTFTFGQVFGVALGVFLVTAAKDLTITFAD